MSDLSFRTSTVTHGESIPEKYTWEADDRSPELTIGDVSDDAAALAVVVDDPDAPGGTFTLSVLDQDGARSGRRCRTNSTSTRWTPRSSLDRSVAGDRFSRATPRTRSPTSPGRDINTWYGYYFDSLKRIFIF